MWVKLDRLLTGVVVFLRVYRPSVVARIKFILEGVKNMKFVVLGFLEIIVQKSQFLASNEGENFFEINIMNTTLFVPKCFHILIGFKKLWTSKTTYPLSTPM